MCALNVDILSIEQTVKFYQIFVGDILQEPQHHVFVIVSRSWWLLLLSRSHARLSVPPLCLHDEVQADHEAHQVTNQD